MTRTSPAVSRVAEILGFLGEHPNQSFNLSQIVKATQINRATCHVLLMSLAEHGYLFRNPDKSYVLGPSLLSLSRKAQESDTVLNVARQEMRLLADELDVAVFFQFRSEEDIVTADYATSASHVGINFPRRISTSIHPWGTIFLYADTDEKIEKSFSRTEPPLSEQDKQAEWAQINFAREHGFVFGVHTFEGAQKTVGVRGSHPQAGTILPNISEDSSYQLQFLIVPVLDEKNRVTFSLALSRFSGSYSCAEIMATAARVKSSCQAINDYKNYTFSTKHQAQTCSPVK